jgi:hypothetical protein
VLVRTGLARTRPSSCWQGRDGLPGTLLSCQGTSSKGPAPGGELSRTGPAWEQPKEGPFHLAVLGLRAA